QRKHPRYGELLDVKRFADPQTFRSSALTQYAGIPEEPPNAELSVYLGRLQSQSIARQLVRQPAFELYRYALLGLADTACGRLADFYPDALWRTQRHGLERFARDTAATNARQAQLKAARAASGGGAAVAADGGTSDNSLMQLRFVAESALGIATQNWTLALEKGTYDFTMPSLPAQQLRVRPSAHGTLIDEIRFRLSAAAGAQHMPLGLNLSDADRESLEAYFAALAASSN